MPCEETHRGMRKTGYAIYSKRLGAARTMQVCRTPCILAVQFAIQRRSHAGMQETEPGLRSPEGEGSAFNVRSWCSKFYEINALCGMG